MAEDFSSYDQYDNSENDPYFISDTSQCLINHLGITNTAELNQAETDISEINMADLERNPVPETYDLAHLMGIHERLFCEVYPFAGQIRLSEIGKSSHMFMPYRLIEEKAVECFTELKCENYLTGLPVKEFTNRAGYYFNKINSMHAFREGNGRTQRVLFNQLAKRSGLAFQWAGVSQQAMGQACREGRTGCPDGKALGKLLSLCVVELEF